MKIQQLILNTLYLQNDIISTLYQHNDTLHLSLPEDSIFFNVIDDNSIGSPILVYAEGESSNNKEFEILIINFRDKGLIKVRDGFIFLGLTNNQDRIGMFIYGKKEEINSYNEMEYQFLTIGDTVSKNTLFERNGLSINERIVASEYHPNSSDHKPQYLLLRTKSVTIVL